ncbi:MAG: response regulator [Acetobacteraceae bacterium]|nr:response regulator [Pseudomonadota bacterium]
MSEMSHVLVVEDDPLVSEVIAAALEDQFRTTIVETAAEALRVLQGGDVRLMLLDCTLPGGLDEDLIPAADRAGASVVLMSGDRGRIDQIVDRPRPFVLKPFSLARLMETVEKAIGDG